MWIGKKLSSMLEQNMSNIDANRTAFLLDVWKMNLNQTMHLLFMSHVNFVSCVHNGMLGRHISEHATWLLVA